MIKLNEKANKILLISFASLICAVVLWYSNGLVNELQREETKKMQQWAAATRLLAKTDMAESEVIDMLLQIVHENTTIPVIVTDDADNVILVRNLSKNDSLLTDDERRKALADMKLLGQCIDISIDKDINQHLYYSDSHIVRRLSYFPAIQISLAALFVLFAYVVFSRARRSEQDKVWIGLARETAHQLGTPISALVGWGDILQTDDIDPKMVGREIRADTDRLQSIADRFSKFGSKTEMTRQPIAPTVRNVADYLQRRVRSKITIVVEDTDGRSLEPLHNPTLIGWAVENVCRNGIDAIQGEGQINIRIHPAGGNTVIDIADTGKGMTRQTAAKIFNAGFTTKKRGWGIGLALAKRIVKVYHRGRIYVKQSEPGRGTTIRMVIKGQ